MDRSHCGGIGRLCAGDGEWDPGPATVDDRKRRRPLDAQGSGGALRLIFGGSKRDAMVFVNVNVIRSSLSPNHLLRSDPEVNSI